MRNGFLFAFFPLYLGLNFSIGNSVFAQSVCSLAARCGNYAGGLQALEVPEAEVSKLAKGTMDIELNLPPQRCWFEQQEVYLYILNPSKTPQLLGRAKLLRIEDPEGAPRGQFGIEEYTPSEKLMAPECYGYCESVLDRLPTPDLKTAIIDLRSRSETLRSPLPASLNLSFTPGMQADKFDLSKLPAAKDTRIVLVPRDNRIDNAQLLNLIRRIRQAGWNRITWIYPGYLGLSGYRLPSPIPEEIRQTTPNALSQLDPKQVYLYYVGLTSDFRPTSFRGISVINASYRPNTRGISKKNPFEIRSFIGNFSFPSKMPPKGSTIVILDRDAADNFKVQAAEALMLEGYYSVYVLRGGLLSLSQIPPEIPGTRTK